MRGRERGTGAGVARPSTALPLEASGRPGRRRGGPGLLAGGGIAFDVPGGAFGFIDVPWTLALSPEPYAAGESDPFPDLPKIPSRARQILVVRAGVGARL